MHLMIDLEFLYHDRSSILIYFWNFSWYCRTDHYNYTLSVIFSSMTVTPFSQNETLLHIVLMFPDSQLRHSFVFEKCQLFPDHCGAKNPCKHGGYLNPSDCKRCLCPSGLGGSYCERHEEDGSKFNEMKEECRLMIESSYGLWWLQTFLDFRW